MMRSLSFILFLSLFLFSCSGSKESTENKEGKEKSLQRDNGDTKGEGTEALVTVKDHSHLDGCRFMLILQDGGKKLNPLNLDTAYFENGLELKVRYKKKDAMTTCMAGETIELLEVERKTEE